MPDFGKLRRYLRLPSRSTARIRQDVEDELRLHIEMRATELEQQGMSAADARAQAMRKFGDLADATSYCADVPSAATLARVRHRHRADARTGDRREHSGVRRAAHVSHPTAAVPAVGP